MTVYGLGGCGKTALANEFAYRVQATHVRLVFWVPAISRESFESAYREIGVRLRIQGVTDDKADIKKLVHETLSSESVDDWLMIVDNADDLRVLLGNTVSDSTTKRLYDYLPYSDRGRILFTTRSKRIAGALTQTNVLGLSEMTKIEAGQLLARHVLQQALLDAETAVTELLETHTYLPLAIVQAAAFINNNDVSISQYMSLFRDSSAREELLSEDFEDSSREFGMGGTIAKTWLLSFEQIRQQEPLAAEYLSLMACIDRNDTTKSQLPPGASLEQQTQALGTLIAYGFVTERLPTAQESKADRFFNIHPLVKMAMVWWLDQHNELALWADKARELRQVLSASISNDNSGMAKQMVGDDDTLVDPSVFSIKHHTSSAEDTLVNEDTSTTQTASFTMFNYQKSFSGVEEDDRADVESLLSGDDISQAETTASMMAYQYAATDIIARALLDDRELSRTYLEAIGRVGQGRFLRNNRRLLRWLSKDLKTSQTLPSEHMAIRFLGRYRGSALVCAAICHDLVGAKIDHQEQSQLEPNEDKKLMLNRFLDQMDSTEQSGFLEPSQDRDYQDAPPSDDDDSDITSSDDENDGDHFEGKETEKLEATVNFLVSGQPFQLYKRRLHEWLHPPSVAHASKQDDAVNTGSSSENIISVSRLTVPVENVDALTVSDKLVRHIGDETDEADDFTLSRSTDTTLPIPSGESDSPSQHKSSKKSQGIAVVSQQKDNQWDSIFALSLPLLVDRMMRHLPFPSPEPKVSTGKFRIRWKLVRCGLRSLCSILILSSGQ